MLGRTVALSRRLTRGFLNLCGVSRQTGEKKHCDCAAIFVGSVNNGTTPRKHALLDDKNLLLLDRDLLLLEPSVGIVFSTSFDHFVDSFLSGC